MVRNIRDGGEHQLVDTENKRRDTRASDRWLIKDALETEVF